MIVSGDGTIKIPTTGGAQGIIATERKTGEARAVTVLIANLDVANRVGIATAQKTLTETDEGKERTKWKRPTIPMSESRGEKKTVSMAMRTTTMLLP
jgi:hypothetical protein